ncbi:50S ribosomal protein L22 [Chryseotalea sanaruensis]|jgi:large subunit ribosomal protein L22|uniref:Large ribosomal subunit protein uL22 n=1 Tax=Chryseotalea sanaruensis TaxID=2482724 RepID=A0A401UF82_9BACT|nr:50S ribosomal protein L22 [Chryseotalea sanaruensis]GCC53568.1 50S ribosomal protein L22 [Chryseotalea sanaruensis]
MEATETKKIKKSVLKREKRDAKKEAAKTGPVVAKLKNVPSSPRKMRLVTDLIKGQRVGQALNILKYQPQIGAEKLEKLLLSAIANWGNTHEMKIEDADLFVKEIWVDGGRMLKRMRPAPQGRGYRIRKRSNHVTLVLGSLASENKVQSAETK